MLGGGGDGEETAGGAPEEIFLEPVRSVGPDPFGPDVSTPPPDNTIPLGTIDSTTTSASLDSGSSTSGATTTGVVTVRGTAPGLYGGTQDQASCDQGALTAFLEGDAEKAAAWSSVIGIRPDQVRTYVDGLTPVLLQADTRVTNHGFRSGRATPRQSVLQAGTAVLVDDTGVPRVRCACGNPLAPPQPAAQTFTGEPWAGFDPANVQAVTAGAPTDSFTLRDVTTGRPLERPVGIAGAAGLGGSTATSTATTAATTTTTAAPTTTAAVQQAVDVGPRGTVVASSEYSNEFPAALATDGDVTTSWFSAGVAGDGGDDSLFLWTAPRPGQITRVTVVGNARHPAFPTGFGFESVTVRVLDGSGVAVFEQDVPLPGTPDPDITVEPNVVGAQVALLFHGHEAADCGGFAELQVFLR